MRRDLLATFGRLLPWVTLMIAALLMWKDTLPYRFVNWDDEAYVLQNPLIRGWSSDNLKGIATEVVTRNYAPLTIFSFLLDHTFWGLNPAGYRLTNLLLHGLNGLLVFAVMRRFCGGQFAAWLTAALFLVHPIQVESVVWISSRKGLLCSAFMLGAVYIRMRPEPSARHDGWYLLLLVLALLAKAHAVILPPVILLYDLLVTRRRPIESIAASIIPAQIAFLFLVMTMGAQNSIGGGVRGHMDLGLFRILEADTLILLEYLRMLLLPLGQCVLYDPPVTGIHLAAFIATAGWLTVLWFAWRSRRSQPLFLFGYLTVLMLMLPVLNIMPITTMMNDRYMYLPCIIVFGTVTTWLGKGIEATSECFRRAGLRRGLQTATAGMLLGFAMVRTTEYVPVWQDSFSLWQHTVARYPEMPVVQIQLAFTEAQHGRLSTAVEIMERALVECQPDDLDRERMHRLVRDWRSEAHRLSQTASEHDLTSFREVSERK